MLGNNHEKELQWALMPTAQPEDLSPPSGARDGADEVAPRGSSSDVAAQPTEFHGSQGVQEITGATLSLFYAKWWLLSVTESFYDSYCPYLQRSTTSLFIWRYWRNASTPWKKMRGYHTKTMSRWGKPKSAVFVDHSSWLRQEGCRATTARVRTC